MTEEITIDYKKECSNLLAEKNALLCRYEEIREQLKQAENTVNECHKYLAELEDKIESLEQENKSLYEEKSCLHKIIDRLLENAGYSKDIASAEDFEDVYEDMQRKINELAELEQENKELKIYIESNKQQVEEAEILVMDNDRLQQEVENLKDIIYYDVEKYRSALEEIREKVKNPITLSCFASAKFVLEQIDKKINEVLNG